MPRLDWGVGIGLHFYNNEEYYETLGYLSKQPQLVKIYTHKNDLSGAWAGQGKLHNKLTLHNLPRPLFVAFSDSGDDRLSVTDYVRNLIDNHAFRDFWDPTGKMYTFYRKPVSLESVARTVPEEYLEDFYRGYDM